MPLPEAFLEHLRNEGYHPRSDKHSNALAECIVSDLLGICAPLAEQAQKGEVVYKLNMSLRYSNSVWNVDLVLGKPAVPLEPPQGSISRATPASVRVAVELKSVMTEHRKAVQNRKRDLEAHHEHVHSYNPQAVAGAVLLVNAAEQFRSPLRTEITIHGDQQRTNVLVDHCVTQMRNVTERGSALPGIEAKTALVVDFSNIRPYMASYVARPVAPQVGDPLHYDSFLRKLCDDYSARFA